VAALAAAVAAGGCGGGGPAVVRVGVDRPGLLDEAATGVVLDGGRVVTVAHVLRGGRAVTVDGRRAVVRRADAAADLALLDVGSGDADGAPDDLTRGILDGGDDGGDPTGPAVARVVRDGTVRDLPVRVVRRVTARVGRAGAARRVARPALELAGGGIRAGDSGAPVLDGSGRVLGVVFARGAGPARTAWAVDAAAVRALLARG
jgi:hypothetical protein